LVDAGLHYVLDVGGREELYKLATDPLELKNLMNDPALVTALDRLRTTFGDILRGNPNAGGAAADYQKRFRMLLESRIPRPAISSG
jgi:hypothetical protein